MVGGAGWRRPRWRSIGGRRLRRCPGKWRGWGWLREVGVAVSIWIEIERCGAGEVDGDWNGWVGGNVWRVRGSRGGRRRGGSGKGIRVWIGEGCERRLGGGWLKDQCSPRVSAGGLGGLGPAASWAWPRLEEGRGWLVACPTGWAASPRKKTFSCLFIFNLILKAFAKQF